MQGLTLSALLDQVVLGAALGALMGEYDRGVSLISWINSSLNLGLAFCHLMKLSDRLGFMDRESFVAQSLALSIFTIGVVSTIGSDDLLAAFAAGKFLTKPGVTTVPEIFQVVRLRGTGMSNRTEWGKLSQLSLISS